MIVKTEAVVIPLPWPPSTNTYYRHVELPLGKFRCPKCGHQKSRVATLLSAEGRLWLKTVSGILAQTGVRPISGPVEVTVVLCPPNRRAIDIDNRQKPLLDALKRRPKDTKQEAWLFAEDDSQVRRLVTEFGPIVPEGRCTVTVRQIEVDQYELPL